MAEAKTVDAGGRTEAILGAAVRLFTQFGYRRTAMDDIAREAGVSKGTLYLYFAGKAAVFRAMQQRNFEDVERRCEDAGTANGSFRDRLARILEANYGWMHARYGGSEHLSELGAARRSVGGDLAEAYDRAYFERLVRFFDAANAAGEINLALSGISAHDLIETLLAAARGAKHSAAAEPVSPENYRQSLLRIAAMTAAAVRSD
jgi:AcrR family transcriptional regulator